MSLELPEVINRQSLNETWVDATPDGGYAIRILEAYRCKCDCRWVVHGVNNATCEMYKQMNRDQEARARELDQAIEWLRGEPYPTDP